MNYTISHEPLLLLNSPFVQVENSIPYCCCCCLALTFFSLVCLNSLLTSSLLFTTDSIAHPLFDAESFYLLVDLLAETRFVSNLFILIYPKYSRSKFIHNSQPDQTMFQMAIYLFCKVELEFPIYCHCVIAGNLVQFA